MPAALPFLRLDSAQEARVQRVMELVRNVCHLCPAEWLQCSVANQHAGSPPLELFPATFEPKQQSREETSRNKSGFGMQDKDFFTSSAPFNVHGNVRTPGNGSSPLDVNEIDSRLEVYALERMLASSNACDSGDIQDCRLRTPVSCSFE